MRKILRRLITQHAPHLVLRKDVVTEPEQDISAAVKTNGMSSGWLTFNPLPSHWTVEDVMRECACDQQIAEFRMLFKEGGSAFVVQFDHNYSVEDYLKAHPEVAIAEAEDRVGWAHRNFAALTQNESATFVSRFAGDPWKVQVNV